MANCKICDRKTVTHFNIDFKAVPICEDCAASIFIQQAQDYVKQHYVIESEDKKTSKKENKE